MKTDKDQIVAAALILLNERGLEGLTTRALAERLGIKQPALYWHFKDRRALLDAMNAAIEADFNAAAPPPAAMAWQDYVFQMGRDFRSALMAYRDGARVHAGTRANRAQLERHMAVLVRNGLPIPLSVQLLVSVGRFVVGWVLEEQAEASLLPGVLPIPPADRGSLAGQTIRTFFDMGDQAAFEAGLKMLIAGAEHASEAERTGKTHHTQMKPAADSP
ncbi:MAG: TetR/AcrR family transcriptional regulator C-terminal domain-containing protein [bacterium]